MVGLYNLPVDVKHVDFFALEVDVGICNLFRVSEVESHLHEAVVDFARMEVDVERVLD